MDPTIDTLNKEQLMALSPFAWAEFGELQLVAGPFMYLRHEYQYDMLECTARRQCACKATQMAFTETAVIRALHSLINRRYPQGALYLFPTADDVTDFSASRFSPLIKDNPDLVARHVKDTNRENLKRIGNGYLFFRGARVQQKTEAGLKSASKLKSIPVDAVYFDEVDEMDQAAVPLALARMEHSELKEEYYLGNPTIPDYGIDAMFQESSQRYWHLKCGKCGQYTNMELEFPECLEETQGRVIRLCVHCRDRELDAHAGMWIPIRPELEDEFVGWSISHLCSAFKDPADILRAYYDPKTDLQSFYNLDLGKAYIAAENRLTKNDVYGCCSDDPMAVNHPGPCAMGVDVGKTLNVVIGYRKNWHTLKAIKFARVSSFNDVHDLGERYNVKCAVFDMYPETRTVRQYQKDHSYQVFLCDYKEYQRGDFAFNDKTGDLMVNRTEICDATHELVTGLGEYEIPRKSKEVLEYAKQMTNIAKVLEEDKETGSKIYRYKKLSAADHYRHATNYFYLAATRVGIAGNKGLKRFFQKRPGKSWKTA